MNLGFPEWFKELFRSHRTITKGDIELINSITPLISSEKFSIVRIKVANESMKIYDIRVRRKELE